MGARLTVGVNDFATVYPELASEALFDPTTVTANSGQKLPWRCSRGHEWEAVVFSRSRGGGCPYCAGKRPIVGESDLATTNPELVAEALFDPTTVSAGSEKKRPWRCPQGHEYETVVAYRATRGTGCPVCANKEVRPGVNDLATLFPEIAAEALFDASTVSVGSKAKVNWRCPQGHEYSTQVVARTSRGVGCSYCVNQAVLPGFNDLATTHPELAAEALFDPTTITFGSGKPMLWRCSKGHEYKSSPAKRRRGDGCHICSGRELARGVNDLATTHPEIAAQAVIDEGFDPTRVTFGHNSRMKWRCEFGHEWLATPNGRTSSKTGCPVCAGQVVVPGFNDIATTDPVLAREATFDPTTVSRGSAKKAGWRCELGHEWEATPASRTNLKSGCPYCSGRFAWPGFNDLATTHPELAGEMATDRGFDPTTFTAGSGRKALWRCDQGHEWKAVVGSRAAQGTGCPVCANSGFNITEPAWLYLMRHDGWDMLQVGITNDPKVRATTHARNGWVPVDIRGPMDGVLAQEWETSIVRLLRARGVDMTPSGAAEQPARTGSVRRNGEAWWRDDYSPASVRELMDAVEAAEADAATRKRRKPTSRELQLGEGSPENVGGSRPVVPMLDGKRSGPEYAVDEPEGCGSVE